MIPTAEDPSFYLDVETDDCVSIFENEHGLWLQVESGSERAVVRLTDELRDFLLGELQ